MTRCSTYSWMDVDLCFQWVNAVPVHRVELLMFSQQYCHQ